MSGISGTHSARFDVFEIGGAAEDKVGAAAFVRRLLVTLFAFAAGEEKPALKGVAPGRRLMNKITCGLKED